MWMRLWKECKEREFGVWNSISRNFALVRLAFPQIYFACPTELRYLDIAPAYILCGP